MDYSLERGIKMHIHGGDVYKNTCRLDFSANINFLGMPEEVRQAAKDSIDRAVLYPDPNCTLLKEAIAGHYQVRKEQIFCGNGAAEVIFLLVQTVQPRKALLLAPCFFEYEKALRAYGADVFYHELKEEKDFSPDASLLEQIDPSLDIMFLCNPNNPTGQLVEQGLLVQILEKCKQCQVLLVVDECFNDFLEEPKEHTLLSYLEEYKNLFLLKAFTKMYAIPGLRLGYGLWADVDLLEKMRERVQPWSVSVPAQAAGTAAFSLEDFEEKTRNAVKEEKKYLIRNLSGLGMGVIAGTANYIFFKGEATLFDSCMKEGIMIRDCSNFYGLGQGFYRIAVKSHEDNAMLIQVLREMRKRENG